MCISGGWRSRRRLAHERATRRLQGVQEARTRLLVALGGRQRDWALQARSAAAALVAPPELRRMLVEALEDRADAYEPESAPTWRKWSEPDADGLVWLAEEAQVRLAALRPGDVVEVTSPLGPVGRPVQVALVETPAGGLVTGELHPRLVRTSAGFCDRDGCRAGAGAVADAAGGVPVMGGDRSWLVPGADVVEVYDAAGRPGRLARVTKTQAVLESGDRYMIRSLRRLGDGDAWRTYRLLPADDPGAIRALRVTRERAALEVVRRCYDALMSTTRSRVWRDQDGPAFVHAARGLRDAAQRVVDLYETEEG